MALHFQSYGQGQPLILLHGLLGALDNWHGLSLQLARDLHVIAVDQRNHGRSPHCAQMDYPLMAQDLEELLQMLGLPSAFVLGHSMGGKAAMQFALNHPERVEKLIVADIAPRAYAPRHEKIFKALLAIAPAMFQTRKQVEDALAPEIPDLATRRFLLKNLSRTPEGGFRWKIGLREIYQNYPRLSAGLQSERPFAKPALFLRGARSDFLVEEDLPAIQRLFPQARLETIPHAGHLLHTENPSAFLEAVLRFVH